VNQQDLNFNFFFYLDGRYWKKRKDPLDFDSFKKNFMLADGYCKLEENLEVSMVLNVYEKYVSVFDSCENFPKYKKSKLHQVLSFCNVNSNINFYLDRGFNINSAKEELKLRQSTVSLESFVRRFGEIEGAKRYNSYLDKWKKSISIHDKDELYKNWKNTPENYLNKINPITGKLFTIQEAKNKIKEDLSKGFKRVWKEYREGLRDKSFVSTTLEYYESKGMTTEEAQLALNERQRTFTLEKCIHKYGYEDGIKRFKDRNYKWQKTLDSKTDDEKKAIMLSKTRNLCRYSKESFIFFNSLLSRIDENLLSGLDIYFGKKEMVLWEPSKKRPYFYDFSIPSLKVIIEYNGSTFHPSLEKLNKKELMAWKCPLTKLNGLDKHKKDMEKNDFARSLGYELLVVWDYEEFESKLKKCIELIKKKIR
jgi:hypothetical protein